VVIVARHPAKYVMQKTMIAMGRLTRRQKTDVRVSNVRTLMETRAIGVMRLKTVLIPFFSSV